RRPLSSSVRPIFSVWPCALLGLTVYRRSLLRSRLGLACVSYAFARFGNSLWRASSSAVVTAHLGASCSSSSVVCACSSALRRPLALGSVSAYLRRCASAICSARSRLLVTLRGEPSSSTGRSALRFTYAPTPLTAFGLTIRSSGPPGWRLRYDRGVSGRRPRSSGVRLHGQDETAPCRLFLTRCGAVSRWATAIFHAIKSVTSTSEAHDTGRGVPGRSGWRVCPPLRSCS